MASRFRVGRLLWPAVPAAALGVLVWLEPAAEIHAAPPTHKATVQHAVAFDISDRLDGHAATNDPPRTRQGRGAPIVPPPITTPAGSAGVEQTSQGAKPAPALVERFDGIGIGFEGPHGPGRFRNPSDNSLAVGPNHIVQTVNSQMAIFTKKGRRFEASGRALYGAVPTNNVFKGFGGTCEARNNGDAVVRYDQLADRWLIVMPIFSRIPFREDQPKATTPTDPAAVSVIGVAKQPGAAAPLFIPPPPPPSDPAAQPGRAGQRGAGGGQRGADPGPQGVYSMCYAISTGADPFGPYYRYEFLRHYFPDYPRPAVWPDGYYIPTSTGDNRISETVATQKHACVVEREKMLKGQPATEQCLIIENVNFLNNADLDGTQLPPAGAPNIMMAAGGTQLDKVFEDDKIFAWQFHVDWKDPSKTRLSGPQAIAVAPYRYLCDGQLTDCVPQPGVDTRLDAQGDKIMARLVYRRVDDRESVVAVHSVNTTAGGGGVRWYELRVGRDRALTLHQQGTYAPDAHFRWMASPAIDRFGNIGIGYSYGSATTATGQRFAGRLAGDPLGQLTLREAVLVDGEGAQVGNRRWQDYTQTAVDPSDDCTIWYVGDYYKKDATNYSTKIGSFRLGRCGR
jgi:hypothetical protein